MGIWVSQAFKQGELALSSIQGRVDLVLEQMPGLVTLQQMLQVCNARVNNYHYREACCLWGQTSAATYVIDGKLQLKHAPAFSKNIT